MNRIASISLLIYYLFGTLWLPDGNFSILPDLPEMYRHCQATEDKNLTYFEFITDHLVDFDGIFEANDDADEKPHIPIQFHNLQVLNIFISETTGISMAEPPLPVHEHVSYHKVLFASDHISKIFHPPLFLS